MASDNNSVRKMWGGASDHGKYGWPVQLLLWPYLWRIKCRLTNFLDNQLWNRKIPVRMPSWHVWHSMEWLGQRMEWPKMLGQKIPSTHQQNKDTMDQKAGENLLKTWKIELCKESHNGTEFSFCYKYHQSEVKRRDPFKKVAGDPFPYAYAPNECSNKWEYLYHPLVYKTENCITYAKDGYCPYKGACAHRWDTAGSWLGNGTDGDTDMSIKEMTTTSTNLFRDVSLMIWCDTCCLVTKQMLAIYTIIIWEPMKYYGLAPIITQTRSASFLWSSLSSIYRSDTS